MTTPLSADDLDEMRRVPITDDVVRLVAEVERLTAELELTRRERDAALNGLTRLGSYVEDRKRLWWTRNGTRYEEVEAFADKLAEITISLKAAALASGEAQ